MIKTAIYMTVANLISHAPVRGTVKLDAPLITKDNAAEAGECHLGDGLPLHGRAKDRLVGESNADGAEPLAMAKYRDFGRASR